MFPIEKKGVYHRFGTQPYKRKHHTQYDKLYYDVKWQLEHGWMVGVDTSEHWDHIRNPFYFDESSNLTYDCFMDHYGGVFEREVRDIYEYSLNAYQGRKPARPSGNIMLMHQCNMRSQQRPSIAKLPGDFWLRVEFIMVISKGFIRLLSSLVVMRQPDITR